MTSGTPAASVRVVLFRVDAGPTIGLGHAVRCTTLADAIADRGGRCIFLSTDGAAWSHLHRKTRHEVRILDVESPGSAADAMRTAHHATTLGAEWLVVDGYAFGADFAPPSNDMRVLWIDDLGFPDHRSGLVLNANLYATSDLYPQVDASHLLLGPRHALLRDEFLAHRERRRHDRHGPPRVLVTLGGSDPPDAGARVLAAIDLLRAEREIEARILVGRANPRAGQLAQRPDVVVDPGSVAEHMRWCDVAVTAAGGTCLELACLGIPGLAIAIADNQRGVADALAKDGMMQSLGWHADVTPIVIAAALAALLDDPERQGAMRVRQQLAVDGRGATRVAERLAETAP